ncbi:lysophospholipase [Sphingomonas sp. MG17]|uniref:Lysophospholipase n=1 Tax=Sphingomonas tagetis TaxID=2949092 RepID=A0A9X2KN00_9SPHN|nr:lysophospholipase [Sphingomonas tagetis]
MTRPGGTEAFDAPDGLAGYRWRATRPRASLLLQHGYAEHAGRYVDHANGLIPNLTSLGIEVFAFDLAGHGRSPGRRGDTNVFRMIQVHMSMRHAIASAARPIFLLGHSLGGLVTAASAAAAPGGIAGVLLSAPALPFDVPTRQRLLVRTIAAILPMAGVTPPGDGGELSRIEAEVRAYQADPLIFRRKLPARIADSAVRAADRMWRALPDWRAPTLVVHGTADCATDPDGSRRLTNMISSSDKELLMVADGRHELLNDVARDATLAHMLDWLDRRIGGAMVA